MGSKELLLIPCCQKKSEQAGKARDVYKGILYPDKTWSAVKK